MRAITNEEYIKQARASYQEEGTLEIDDSAAVSLEDGARTDKDGGAYVAAWVWVENADIRETRRAGR